MAHFAFSEGKRGLLNATIRWETATIKVAMAKNYTPDATDVMVSDMAGSGYTGIVNSTVMTGCTIDSTGKFLANPMTITSTPYDPLNSYGLVVYQASAASGGPDLNTNAQRLIFWFDTSTYIPIKPVGSNVDIDWSQYVYWGLTV
jgi:hypothetical protein